MTPEKWQAAALTLGSAALIAGSLMIPIERLLKRFDRSDTARSAIAGGFFAAFFAFAILIEPSYLEEPLLVGLQSGLLGVACGQFGSLVAHRKSPRAP